MMMINHLTPREEAEFGPHKLEEFKYDLHKFVEIGEHADWFGAVLTALVPEYRSGRLTGLPVKRDWIEADLASQIEEARAEDLEDFESDPTEWATRSGRSEPTGEHPWGDATVALARAWCQATPYEVYAVRTAADAAVREELAGVLLPIASGEGHKEDPNRLAEAARRSFEDSLKAILKRLT